MAKKKKGNPKYKITNVTSGEIILSELTQKASLEWLYEQYEEMDDNAHIKFATAIYGKKLPEKGFHISSIKAINKVAVVDRFKKILKKEIPLQNGTFKVEIEESVEL